MSSGGNFTTVSKKNYDFAVKYGISAPYKVSFEDEGKFKIVIFCSWKGEFSINTIKILYSDFKESNRDYLTCYILRDNIQIPILHIAITWENVSDEVKSMILQMSLFHQISVFKKLDKESIKKIIEFGYRPNHDDMEELIERNYFDIYIDNIAFIRNDNFSDTVSFITKCNGRRLRYLAPLQNAPKDFLVSTDSSSRSNLFYIGLYDYKLYIKLMIKFPIICTEKNNLLVTDLILLNEYGIQDDHIIAILKIAILNGLDIKFCMHILVFNFTKMNRFKVIEYILVKIEHLGFQFSQEIYNAIINALYISGVLPDSSYNIVKILYNVLYKNISIKQKEAKLKAEFKPKLIDYSKLASSKMDTLSFNSILKVIYYTEKRDFESVEFLFVNLGVEEQKLIDQNDNIIDMTNSLFFNWVYNLKDYVNTSMLYSESMLSLYPSFSNAYYTYGEADVKKIVIPGLNEFHRFAKDIRKSIKDNSKKALDVKREEEEEEEEEDEEEEEEEEEEKKIENFISIIDSIPLHRNFLKHHLKSNPEMHIIATIDRINAEFTIDIVDNTYVITWSDNNGEHKLSFAKSNKKYTKKRIYRFLGRNIIKPDLYHTFSYGFETIAHLLSYRRVVIDNVTTLYFIGKLDGVKGEIEIAIKNDVAFHRFFVPLQ